MNTKLIEQSGLNLKLIDAYSSALRGGWVFEGPLDLDRKRIILSMLTSGSSVLTSGSSVHANGSSVHANESSVHANGSSGTTPMYFPEQRVPATPESRAMSNLYLMTRF